VSPLAGVRLLSFALNVPGPVAVARLVAEGASAVKVEPPGGDPLATYSRSWYDALHAGVAVATVDLKSAEGCAERDRLLGQADVLITSQRPSALVRMGLDSAHLSGQVPALRAVTIVGDTAASERAGHDLTYQAEAGLVRDRLPVTLLADLFGAERVVAAVLLALRSAPGTNLRVGLHDVVADLRAPIEHGLTMPGGRLGGGDPAYGMYRTRDGWIAVAALEPRFRARLYGALALPLDAPLEDALAVRTGADWTAFATEHDLPMSVVGSGSERRTRPRARPPK
jgi:alpha-methylacyl-CoA racemase